MRLIDADALKQQFEIYDEDDEVAVWSIMNEINFAPTIAPGRKKGKWIEATADGIVTFDKNAYAQCSVCDKREFLGWRKNFCPNCGANMRGEADG